MGRLAITIEGYTYEIDLDWIPQDGSEFTVMVDGSPVQVLLPSHNPGADEVEWFIVGERPYEVAIDPDLHWVKSRQGIYPLEVQDLEVVSMKPPMGDGRIKAPIPGQITQVLVGVGEQVDAGQPLLVLEAMKMENEIRASHFGTVKTINVTPGQTVKIHEVLIEID